MSEKRKRRYSSSDSEDDEYIRWKIARLKRRLTTKSRGKNGRHSQIDKDDTKSFRSISPSSQGPGSSQPEYIISSSEFSEDDHLPLSVLATNGDSRTQAVPANETINTEKREPSLEASILALLGDEQPPPELLGPYIHEDVASRWSFILTKGLNEEVVNTLSKKYPPAENCPLLKGPRINPEILSVLNEQVTRRDSNLMGLQNQIGAAISALGQLTTALVSEGEGTKHTYIELASDASRLLLNFHHKYSVIRQDLILLNLRKELKDTLTNVSSDEWLFGKNLGERIKASKDMERVGLDLKPARSSRPNNIPAKPSTRPVQGNSQRPPRQVQKGNYRSGRQNKAIPSQSFHQRPYPIQRKAIHNQDRGRRPSTSVRPSHRHSR